MPSQDSFTFRATRYEQCYQQPCIYHVFKDGLCKKHYEDKDAERMRYSRKSRQPAGKE